MQHLPSVDNAWLLMDKGVIIDYGDEKTPRPHANEVIDAAGGMVMPAFCDSHTHIVFAATRENEFVDRIRGLSYEEIARRGGGILNSSARLQQTSEDELYATSHARLHEMIRMGTGAIEIKSGYGLTTEDELKMLRVIKRLKATSPIPVKATFLGAHALPAEFKNKRAEYITLIVEEMLPAIAHEQLADYCDVFCDRGFFTPEETDQILKASTALGMEAKIHANELDYSGGIQIGVSNNALSVDHLEFTGDDEIKALLGTRTMPTLLPSTAFFLGLEYPPARKMIDAGLPIALSSDYNPGSSPSGNMNFVISLACIKLKMTPEEAINAATINSAYAMGLAGKAGCITKGLPANLIITKPVSALAAIPYSFGLPLIQCVVINGENLN